MALDFGDNNVGLAVSDEMRQFVFGKGVLRDFGSLEKLGEMLAEIVEKEGIVEVVFGLPMGAKGEETEQTARYRSIGERLQGMLGGIPFSYVDESFSSFEAGEAGRSKKLFNEHEQAAMEILRRFIS